MVAALTSDEITALAGPSTVDAIELYAVPTTAGATARVNGAPTFPVADIAVDTTSADWLTIAKAGRTCWIGSSAGARDYGTYRLRKDAGASTLYLMQIGSGDPGRRAFNLRPTAIPDNAYITILQSGYDLWTAFPLIAYDGTNATFYKDFDRVYVNENSVPPPMVRLGKHQVYEADAVTDQASISITASVDLWPTSSSVTYAWTYPASWTGVSGTTSATLTATAVSGFYEATCTVTTDNGAVSVATRMIWVKGANLQPYLFTRLNSDNSTLEGWRASLSFNGDLLSNIPEGTTVHIRLRCTWNGSATSVPSAILDFTGWIVTESWMTTPGLRQGDVEIVGPAEILRNLNNNSQRLDEVQAAPTSWQEVIPSLCKIRYMIHYMLVYHAANLLRLFDFYIDSTGTTDDRLPALIAPRGALWAQIKMLAWRAYLEVTCDEIGAIRVGRRPDRTAIGSRSGIVNRATIDADIFQSSNVNRRIAPPLAFQRGESLSYAAGVGSPVAYLSHAPGLDTPGQGVGENALTEQIVDGQGTINQRTGLENAIANAEYESVTFTIKKAYTVISPAQLYFVTLQNLAALMPRNVALNAKFIPTQVTRSYPAPGIMDTTITCIPETSGVDGETKPVDPPNDSLSGDYSGGDWATDQIAPIIEPLPEIDFGSTFTYTPDTLMTLDPKPGAVQQYGRLFGVSSDAHVWKWTGNGSGGTFADISPTADQRSAIGAVDVPMRCDPYNLKRWVVRGATGVAFTNDITASTVAWTTAIRTTRKVTFDSGGYSSYSIVDGTLQGSGGNPGSYLLSPTTVGASLVYAIIDLRFSKPIRITGASYETKLVTGSGGHGGTFYMFDKDDNLISYDSDISVSAGWVPRSSTVTSQPGVCRIRFLASTGLSSSGLSVGLDNCSFTYTDNDGVGTPIGDMQPTLARKNTWYWLSYSGSDLYFNRTLDFFKTIQSYRVASYSAGDHVYSFTVKRKDWRVIYVAGGSGAALDRGIFRSTDAGQTWEAIASLNTKGGLPWWNSSTKTANVVNASEANLRHIRGLDGSNNYQLVEGVTGFPIDILTADATRYAQAALALGFLTRDLDIGMYLARTGNVYKTADSGDTWSAATSITGGSSFVVYGGFQWPADAQFWGYFGYRCLGYTTNFGTAWTSLWSAYDTFRSGAYSSEGEALISVAPYIGDKYPVPVV